MIRVLLLALSAARSSLQSRRALALENLALRQQLAVLRRQAKRPKLRRADRVFWVMLARVWPGWRTALTIVQPATVIRWHRQGFARYWSWKSRPRGGRPRKDAEIRPLIRQMARDNVGWGAPRIHGELRQLGFVVSEATVSRAMPRRSGPPSQTWRTLLADHLPGAAAIDCFGVPTATFRTLYGLVILAHDRRRIVHFNVTDAPSARWTGQQVINAFPYEPAPRYLHRDRDAIYGGELISRVRAMGIEQIVSAARSPWQNPYVERVIGSLRRECTDHVIVTGVAHLQRVLRAYVVYYNTDRTHLALAKDPPVPRSVRPPGYGQVIGLPRVGGLHHRYERRAA
jgi:transposase InsO family protein